MVIKLFDVYYENDDFSFGTTTIDGEVHLHVVCENWSLSVLKQMYSVWGGFLNVMQERGVDVLYSLSPNPKFCRLMGGEGHGTYVHPSGMTIEAMKWDLKQQLGSR